MCILTDVYALYTQPYTRVGFKPKTFAMLELAFGQGSCGGGNPDVTHEKRTSARGEAAKRLYQLVKLTVIHGHEILIYAFFLTNHRQLDIILFSI